MKEYIRENIQLYVLFILWITVGIANIPVSYVLISISLLLLWKKGMYEEILMGYFLILLLSDSLVPNLLFAKNAKNIYIVLITLFFFLDREKFQPYNKLYKLYIPFFLFSVFTMFLSVNENFFFMSLQKTVSYFLSFFIVPNYIILLYRQHKEAFLRRFIFLGTIFLILGFVFIVINRDLVYEVGRFRGIVGNPNGMGIFCSLFLMFFNFISNRFKNLFSKQEKIFIYILIFMSVILCGSRNAIISIFIFYTFLQFFYLSPLLGFISFILTVFVSEIISNNLVSIIRSLGLEDYFRLNTLEEGSGRYIAWEFAWEQIQTNFFVGKGFAYNEFYMRQNYALLQKMGHQGGIHNSFLTFWFDQGLIGLLIYIRSYVLMFIKASRNTKYSFPILFAISFTAFFESWLVGSLSVYAFLAVSIFTLITSEEIKQEEESLNVESVAIG